jgi:hypothetical protein
LGNIIPNNTKQPVAAAEGVFLCAYNSPNSLRFLLFPTFESVTAKMGESVILTLAQN